MKLVVDALTACSADTELWLLFDANAEEGKASFGSAVVLSLVEDPAPEAGPLPIAWVTVELGEANKLDDGLGPKLKRLAKTEFGSLSLGCSGTPAEAGGRSSSSSFAEKPRDLGSVVERKRCSRALTAR